MTIVEFITARLDEREQSAQFTIELTERAYPADEFKVSYKWARLTEHRTSGGGGQSFAPGAPTPEEVLADIAAKRAIIEEHEGHQERVSMALAHELSPAHADQRQQATWTVLRHLASVYSEHPDYDQAWRP